LALHVQGAPSPDLAVAQLPAERIGAPLGGVGEHHVGVGEEEEARTAAAPGYACDEVRAFGYAGEQLGVDTVVAEVLAQKLRREPVELLVVSPSDVQRAKVEARSSNRSVERAAEQRSHTPDLAETRGVEAAPVSEHAANLLVLPRRHLLEHVELAGDELQAER